MAEAEVKRLRKAAQRKESAEKSEAKKRAAMTDEELQDHIKDQVKQAGKNQERKADIDRRHKLGFVHDGSRRVRGQRLEPFSEIFNGGVRDDGTKLPEVVFRSQLAPALHRVMMCYPKKGAIWVGMDKTAVFRVYSKALALDYPYVTINQKMLGLIAVDLDGSFESEADLRRQLSRYLTPDQMPTMAVGTWNKDTGRFENPHLIWILNDPVLNMVRQKHVSTVETLGPVVVKSERVVYSGSKGCRPAPIRTYHAVQRGLVHLLLPLGADSGCFNIYKVKNPLSPYWSTILLNEKNYHDLKPFFAMTWEDDDKKKHRFIGDPSDAVMAEAARRAMITRHVKVAPSHSNIVWSTIGRLIERTLKFAEATQEAAYLEAVQDKNTFYTYLVDRVTPEAFQEFGNADVVTDNIHNRCQFTASRWEANKPARYNEGRDAAFEPVVDRSKPLSRTAVHHNEEPSSEPWQATRAPELARNGQQPSFDADAIYSGADTLNGEEAPFSPDGSISVRRRGAAGFQEESPFETFDDLDAEVAARHASEADAEDAGQSDGGDWYDPMTGEVRENDAPDVIYGEAPASDADADAAADLADVEIPRSDESHAEQACHAAETASDAFDGESLMDMLLASEGPSALDEAGDNKRKAEPGILTAEQRRAALADVYGRVDALSKLRW